MLGGPSTGMKACDSSRVIRSGRNNWAAGYFKNRGGTDIFMEA